MTQMRIRSTQLIYLATATACSLTMVGSKFAQAPEPNGGVVRYGVLFAVWALLVAAPLLFAFAYPRFLYHPSAGGKRSTYGAILHGSAALLVVIVFCLLAAENKNPVTDFGDSVLALVLPLATLVVFLVGAISLLLRNSSGLTTLASLVFWPYWFALTLSVMGRWFQGNPVYYVLCVLAPIFFAFAAGAIEYRPRAAHVSALVGVVAAPWLYYNVVLDSGVGNAWLMFNVPDDAHWAYPALSIWSAIFAVGLLVLALVTAVIRLLPSSWNIRGTAVCARTWPGVVVALVVMAVWFSQSVIPYRIPGAADYSDYPAFQILHIEKRGLQFHETCVSVGQRAFRMQGEARVSVRTDDHRLLQYRFTDASTSSLLPTPLLDRVRAMIPPLGAPRRQSDFVKPVRDWNADNWYVHADGDMRIYETSKGSRPPQEIVDLFRDLEQLPQSSPWTSELRDVCLGFCFDPLSAMGYLYANHRCFNAGHGTVCR